MEWDDLSAAVRAILDAEWTETPVAYQNEEFQAPDGPWIYCEVLPVDGDDSLFNSPGLGHRTDVGLLAFHVFIPTGTGVAAALRLARLVGKLFSLRTIAPGVQTEGRSLGGAGSSDDEGNWYRVSASVPVTILSTT